MAGINIDGNENILSYSVQENATSLDITDSGGGFGQLSYAIPEQGINNSNPCTVWRSINKGLDIYDPNFQLSSQPPGPWTFSIDARRIGGTGAPTVSIRGRSPENTTTSSVWSTFIPMTGLDGTWRTFTYVRADIGTAWAPGVNIYSLSGKSVEFKNYSVKDANGIEIIPKRIRDWQGWLNWSGGTPTLDTYVENNITVVHPREFIQRSVNLYDPEKGSFSGIVQGINATDGLLNVTANSELYQLNRWYSIAPYSGTLSGYLSQLSTTVGLTVPLTATPEISNLIILVPGYVGNVWEHFRRFLSANSLEVAQIANRLVVRELRTITTYDNWRTTESWDINSQSTTERIKVYYYETTPIQDSREIFPTVSEDTFEPIVVDANAQIVQELPIDGSLLSVNQPECVDYVSANTNATGTLGVYCVAGNDGKPILASRWKAGGGNLTVEVTDDPSIIRVTVTGSKATEYSPYRIAATAGSNSYYNSLHITGRGMQWTKGSISAHTGAERDSTTAESEEEIDHKEITSLGQAFDVIRKASKTRAGGVGTVSGTAVSLNRPGDRTDQVTATFADYDAEESPQTFAQFDAKYSGKFRDFDAIWDSKFSNDLQAQAFGQVIGARARRKYGWFRVTETTTGPNNTSYSMEADTLFGDIIKPMTFAQFDSLYAGSRFVDFDNDPLRSES